jgi:hypothetical protein
MTADIKFNVRHGMTVGTSKTSVLDNNGGLSATNLDVDSQQTGGQILSGGTDLLDIFSGGDGGASNINGLSDVTITSVSTLDTLVYTGSNWANKHDKNTLEVMYTHARDQFFNKLIYTETDALSAIEVFEDNTETVKLFTRLMKYDTTTDTLTAVTTTDNVNGNTLTKTLVYDANDNLETITRAYS